MDIMIDIETLGLKSLSVVTQIAVVPFKMNDDSLNFGIDFDIDINNSVNNGGEIDPYTLLWVMNNNSKSISNGNKRYMIYDVLEYLGKHIKNIKPDYIWAKSPSFDCVILESWFKRLGLPIPWKYNQLMDVRTIEQLGRTKFGLSKDIDNLHDKYKQENKLHSPVGDCHFQIELIRLVYNYPTPTRITKGVIIDEN